MLVFLQESIPESGNPLLGRQSGGTGTDGRVAVPATRKAASSRGRRPPETTGADSNVDSWSVGATVTLEISESVSWSIGQHLSPAPLRRIDRRWSKVIEKRAVCRKRRSARVPRAAEQSDCGELAEQNYRSRLPDFFFSKADLCVAARRRDRIACHRTFYWWNVASITRPVSRAVNDNGALCVTGNNFSLFEKAEESTAFEKNFTL